MGKINIDKISLNKIKSNYLRFQREDEGMSLNFVSTAININKGTLFRIENSQIQLTDDLFQSLLAFYDCKFEENVEKLESTKSAIIKVFNAYCDFNDEKIEDLFNEYNRVLNKEVDDYSFFHNKLLKSMFDLLIKGTINEEDIKDIIGYLSVFSMNEIRTFYIFVAKYYCENNKNIQSVYYLDKLDEITKDKDDLYQAIGLYIRSAIYQKMNKSYEALQCTRDSLSILSKTSNFERIKYLKLYEINCLSMMGIRKGIEDKYLDLIEHFGHKDKEFKLVVYDNLCWMYIKNAEYKKAIIYTNKAIEEGSTFNELIINNPLAYYMLDEFEHCLEEIEKAYGLDVYFDAFFDVLINCIKQDEVETDNSIEKFLQSAKNKCDHGMLVTCLKVAVKHYTNKNVTKLAKYQNYLIKETEYL